MPQSLGTGNPNSGLLLEQFTHLIIKTSFQALIFIFKLVCEAMTFNMHFNTKFVKLTLCPPPVKVSLYVLLRLSYIQSVPTSNFWDLKLQA